MKRNHVILIFALSLSLVLFLGAFSPSAVFADGSGGDWPQEAPQPPDTTDVTALPSDSDLGDAAATETESTSVLDILNLLLIAV